MIYTNDPRQQRLRLTITGRVEQFVEIIPDPVLLTGRVGEPLKKSVRIVPEEKYAFAITGVKARRGTDIRFHLEEKTFFGKKKGFLLEVENIRKTPGRYLDYLYLHTDSEIQPKLTLKVRGNIYAGNRSSHTPDTPTSGTR